MRRRAWIGAAITASLVVVDALEAHPTDLPPDRNQRVTIVGGRPEQVKIARWAIGRFEAAGLELPPVRIRFHTGLEACYGNAGYFEAGVVTLCGEGTNLFARKTLLHELAHAWAEANVTGGRREAFLELRGLESWNSRFDPWRERGFEQAAELIAWYVGDRVFTPSVPDDKPERVQSAIALLIGGGYEDLVRGEMNVPSAVDELPIPRA